MNKIEEKFRECLKWHDWHYIRADDPRAYKNGRLQANQIEQLKEELLENGYTKQQLKDIWNEECPYEMYHYKLDTK